MYRSRLAFIQFTFTANSFFSCGLRFDDFLKLFESCLINLGLQRPTGDVVEHELTIDAPHNIANNQLPKWSRRS